MGGDLGDNNCAGSLKNASDLHKEEEFRKGHASTWLRCHRREGEHQPKLFGE